MSPLPTAVVLAALGLMTVGLGNMRGSMWATAVGATELLAACSIGAIALRATVETHSWLRQGLRRSAAVLPTIAWAGTTALLVVQLRDALEPTSVWHNPIYAGVLFGLGAGFVVCRTVAITFVDHGISIKSGPANADDGPAVIAVCLREQAFVHFVAAFIALDVSRQPVIDFWIERILLAWVLGVALEGCFRIGSAFFCHASVTTAPAFCNSIRALLDPKAATILRSSRGDAELIAETTKHGLKTGITVAVVVTSATAWLATGIAIVRTDQLGVYYRLGAVSNVPLEPGLHFTLPAPFGEVRRLSVKTIQATTIGFEANVDDLRSQPLLWTCPHGTAEYPLLVGTGAEIVVVNGLLRYKIAETPEGLLRYVSQSADPEAILRSLASQALLRELDGRSLDDAVGLERIQFAARIEQRIHGSLSILPLGIELVDFGVLSVHPPVEVAGPYLEVVSAQIDAESQINEARVNAQSELMRCESMSLSYVADALATASQRLTPLVDETRRFNASVELQSRNSEVVRRRLYCETLAKALERRSLVLVDDRLPDGVELLFGETSYSAPRSNAQR
ncbi:MAG: hypothetical protein JNL96_05010 [Planctomycetaceae bacterium]|nr:hypothetical protein [Planctomycetaceae bacterium]